MEISLKRVLAAAVVAVPLAGCAVSTKHGPVGASSAAATPQNGCVDSFSANLLVVGGARTAYNDGCAERAIRNEFIKSNDPGIQAVGVRASELAGDIPPQAIDEVVGQLNNPRAKQCVVTGKRGNEAVLECDGPILARR